jgi:hypothetical protein
MPPTPPTDAELDVYIKIRYALMGIDISVLPVADDDAPMDQTRLLANARSIIRQDAEATKFVIDPQLYVPTAFPPQFMAWTRE